jgi:tetratricopeptide (TPR) repeat protein
MIIPPCPGAGDRTSTRIIVALAGVIAGAEALGFAIPNGIFWGAEAYAFFPGPVFGAAVIALLGVAVRARRELPLDWSPTEGERRVDRDSWIYPALALAGAATFTLFRAAHFLLGDGVALVTTLPIERSFHPLEPLSMLLEQATYGLLSPFLARAGRDPYQIAWIGSGALSILAGAVFLPVTWAISDHLARRIPGSSPAERGHRALTGLVFLTLASQGYMQIFFGYVEVYALVAATIAVYTLAALRFLDRRARLWPAAVALALAVGFHLSAVALFPSFAILALAAFRAPGLAPLRAREALISLSVLAALPLLLAVLGHGYSLGSALLSVFRDVILRQPDPIPDYFWSWRHLRDLINEQILIGPLALGFVPPVAIAALRRRRASALELGFFATLGLEFATIELIAGDSNLGYARNWDLLAPAGFGLAVAGLGLWLPLFPSPATARRGLALAVAISLFHTVPWIGVNASSNRSLRRFTTLPLELGRVESTVGNWYDLQGDTASAEQWFVRSLERNPANIRSHVGLGDLYSQRGDFRRAAYAYRAAIDLRPESDEYRLQWIGAVLRAGDPAAALPEAKRLVWRQPGNPRFWAVYGIALLGAAHVESARYAFAVASRSAPYNMLYRLMGNYADLPNGFHRAVQDVLGVLLVAS